MKRLFLIVLFATGLGLGIPHQVVGQDCNAEKYKEKCKSRLASGFNYKFTFKVNKELLKGKSEIEYTYALNKGTLYMMNMSDGNGEQKNLIVELYDQNKKLVATNYDSRTGKFMPIGFACNQGGVYHVKIKLKDPSKKCGIVVLAARS